MNKLIIDPKLKALMDPDFVYDSEENLNADQGESVQDHETLHDFDLGRKYDSAAAGAISRVSSPLGENMGHVTAVSPILNGHGHSLLHHHERGDVTAHYHADTHGNGHGDHAGVEPNPDERYLNDNGTFHYTSQFQARTHADKFDFYQGPKEDFHVSVDRSLSLRNPAVFDDHDSNSHSAIPGPHQHQHLITHEPQVNGSFIHNPIGHHTQTHKRSDSHFSGSNKSFLEDDGQYNDDNGKYSGNNDDRYEDGADDENCGSEEYDTASDVSEEYEYQLQDLFQKITKFKNEFHQLISKLDEASLESAKARYRYLNDVNVRENTFMSSTTNVLLDTVAKLLPRKRTSNKSGNGKSHRTTDSTQISCSDSKRPNGKSNSNGTSSNSANPSSNHSGDSLSTLYNASLENDPCSKLPNFGVILIKSPTNVEQLWSEYTKLPSDSNMKALMKLMLQQQSKDTIKKSDIALMKQRKTTIQELERKYGSSWRNSDKNFSRQINRRKKIWGCIEHGLKDGLSLKICFRILDKYVEERGKGLSWYYNGVPFKLVDLAPSYAD
ncbi:unnamed protein product [Kluyveromyces dobzhanskii CBS 2104]|uniref:WGS project CCBQ000000000 data, contig 00058 n=1 Tax=Kluyveromyces dobzhanskii CBS 2104 TaxID=1427455 RepID=A0A0A8LDT6_9SACH|nr:unnamed protein product [Kluyveromyces dobzhanskii CBS 2104]